MDGSAIAKNKLNYSTILLDSPIKFNGIYNVQIVLHPEVTASVLIVVVKTEAEVAGVLVLWVTAKAINAKIFDIKSIKLKSYSFVYS